jgi:hypothetical protein
MEKELVICDHANKKCGCVHDERHFMWPVSKCSDPHLCSRTGEKVKCVPVSKESDHAGE